MTASTAVGNVGVGSWIERRTRVAPAGVALIAGDRPVTYSDLAGRVRRLANGLRARHLRTLLAEGRLPECRIPPGHILECRALLETYHDLRAAHTAWVQRIHAVFFHQGGPPLGEGPPRTGQGLAGLRAAAAAHLSPAGQQQVATALDMLAAVDAQLGPLRKQLRETARQLTGAKVLAERLYGVGPSPRWCLAGCACERRPDPNAPAALLWLPRCRALPSRSSCPVGSVLIAIRPASAPRTCARRRVAIAKQSEAQAAPRAAASGVSATLCR